MQADIEKIVQALRENLDGVTKGPWRPGHLANDDHSCDCGFVFDSLDRMGSIATVNMDDAGQFGKEYPSRNEAKANLKHIVAAQPENIRALLDELSRLRKALTEVRTTIQYGDGDFSDRLNACEEIVERALSTQVEERE